MKHISVGTKLGTCQREPDRDIAPAGAGRRRRAARRRRPDRRDRGGDRALPRSLPDRSGTPGARRRCAAPPNGRLQRWRAIGRHRDCRRCRSPPVRRRAPTRCCSSAALDGRPVGALATEARCRRRVDVGARGRSKRSPVAPPADGRRAPGARRERKNDAMRDLLRTAGLAVGRLDARRPRAAGAEPPARFRPRRRVARARRVGASGVDRRACRGRSADRASLRAANELARERRRRRSCWRLVARRS